MWRRLILFPLSRGVENNDKTAVEVIGACVPFSVHGVSIKIIPEI